MPTMLGDSIPQVPQGESYLSSHCNSLEGHISKLQHHVEGLEVLVGRVYGVTPDVNTAAETSTEDANYEDQLNILLSRLNRMIDRLSEARTKLSEFI